MCCHRSAKDSQQPSVLSLDDVAVTLSEGQGACRADKVSTHKTPDVQRWLRRHTRFTFHFTPTSASWMNEIETWCGNLTRQGIRRGSFGSVKELITMIDTFTNQWNAGATPFSWVKTADEILANAVRNHQHPRFGRPVVRLRKSLAPLAQPKPAAHAISNDLGHQRIATLGRAISRDGVLPAQC